MTDLPKFLVRVARATFPPLKGAGSTYIVVNRTYSHLAKELDTAFERDQDVRIILDRRYGDRRIVQQPIASERRQIERRNSKEKIIEVVIAV